MTTARSEFDHRLANVAMQYVDARGKGISHAALDAVKAGTDYSVMLADWEAKPGDRQALDLACHFVLQGAGYELRDDPKQQGAA